MTNKLFSFFVLVQVALFSGLTIAQVEHDDLVHKLKNTRVLMIPGLLAQSYLATNRMFGVGEYFGPQLELFKQMGVEALRLPIESEASVLANAWVIAQEIRSSPKPVLLMAHSKGGVDALTALLHFPEIRPKLRAFIALQSPFFGTPVADKALDSRRVSLKLKKLLTVLGGSREAIKDLSQRERGRMMSMLHGELAQLAQEVPLLSVGSFKSDEPGKLDSLLEPIRDHLLSEEVSDGLVPLASSLLPFGERVELEEVDHAQPVIPCERFPFDQVQLTLDLLRRVL